MHVDDVEQPQVELFNWKLAGLLNQW